MTDLTGYLHLAKSVPGWIPDADAEAIMQLSYSLPRDAVIVEIGSYMGRSAILLAGPRRLRGTGKVHCVDPFDCSGDAFSVPFYQSILARVGGGALLERFKRNIDRAGLGDWVDVHQGYARDVAAHWTQPIDLLLLDGDQSPAGAREAYESWSPFLKSGGILILRNTKPRQYADGHDGHRRLASEELNPPRYVECTQLLATTIARRSSV